MCALKVYLLTEATMHNTTLFVAAVPFISFQKMFSSQTCIELNFHRIFLSFYTLNSHGFFFKIYTHIIFIGVVVIRTHYFLHESAHATIAPLFFHRVSL